MSVFPNTAISETWVIGLAGCDGTTQCQNVRGGTFAANESTTWESQGTFDSGLDANLGFSGAGYYGLDIIALRFRVFPDTLEILY